MGLIKGSLINPILTINYITNEAENKYFDRKSAKKKPSDLADLISAFANAEGGTIVIGISDKAKSVEGINAFGEDKINNFINAPKDCCKPMPMYEEEFLDVINEDGQADRVLLLHIHASVDQIIRTSNDSTFLRIGDKTRELKGQDLRNLEYSKSTRHYEDECNMNATFEDLDEELIRHYKEILGAIHLPTKQVFSARGFCVERNGRKCLTNAAVLLFAKNIMQFYPNSRVRFLRYEGERAEVGTAMNIVKDINIEAPLLRIIDEAQKVIAGQLREFTALDPATGKFQTVPEYPEFAWLEGLVNAVTHREYGMSGDYIKVSMYDNRLEIQSPGRLPNLVTLDNIRETRFSRNPRIARVLTEFGWVRELNEGVKRIYSDMTDFFLEEPVYTEPGQTVRLVLKNNIEVRKIRQKDRAAKNVGTDAWGELDSLSKEILAFMGTREKVTRIELEKITGKSGRTITLRLNHLIEAGVVQRNGSKHDPTQTYHVL